MVTKMPRSKRVSANKWSLERSDGRCVFVTSLLNLTPDSGGCILMEVKCKNACEQRLYLLFIVMYFSRWKLLSVTVTSRFCERRLIVLRWASFEITLFVNWLRALLKSSNSIVITGVIRAWNCRVSKSLPAALLATSFAGSSLRWCCCRHWRSYFGRLCRTLTWWGHHFTQTWTAFTPICQCALIR